MIKSKLIRPSNKELDFIIGLLNRAFFLKAMISEYDSNDEKEFKENYGMSFKQAEQAQQKVVSWLNRI